MSRLARTATTVMESIGIGVATSHIQKKQPIPVTATNPPAPPLNDHYQNPITQPDTPHKHETVPPTAMNQNTVFWEAYNKAGDDEDKEFVKTSGSDLDALLIFAGLFSAINTAFIIESYKNLKPDPAEETNKLLRSMFSATINPSNATLDSTPFAASSRDVRINSVFFSSLCCSLTAAFGAVLAKQWLTQYDRDGGGSLKSPATRGRERQKKSEGRGKWHLEDVIVTLPTLLQFSLFFFFIGLVDLLWPLNDVIASITLSFTVATFLFYATTIAIATVDKSAPFQTRLSLLLHSPVRRLLAFVVESIARRPKQSNTEVELKVDISCFNYLFERMLEPEHVVILAGAVVSLWDRLERVAITNRFIDVHLKPTVGQMYSLPRLYGPHRPSLLKILAILMKDWKDQETTTIQTPSYPSMDITKFFSATPIALQKAFVADPADTESFQHIINILSTLQDLGHSPFSSDYHDMSVMDLWLDNDMTKALKHTDLVAQRNALKLIMLVAASAGFDEQITAGDVVQRASTKSPGLKKLTELAVVKELWSALPVPNHRSGVLGALPLFSWIATGQVPNGIEELVDMVEALPRGSERVEAEARSFFSRVVETLLFTHLKPEFDGWWRLQGLQGQNKRSLLRILHTIIVKWGYLGADLEMGVPSYQPLQPLLFSLRAELWDAFVAAPGDLEDVLMIAEICRSLPTPEPLNDEITTAVKRKLTADISRLFRNDKPKPMELGNWLTMLSSNANLLVFLINFDTIFLSSETRFMIPNLLHSTMWVGDAVDLEDFWWATFRIQLLAAFLPIKSFTVSRLPEYLHLWFERYNPRRRTHKERGLPMCWVYLLSLQRILSKCPRLARKLKKHGHPSHLLDIYLLRDSERDSRSLLALYLFLRLWDNNTHDMNLVHVMNIIVGLQGLELSLVRTTRDFRVYAQSSRAGGLSDEQWGEEISGQVARNMGQMVKWLYTYLEAAVRSGVVGVSTSYWAEKLENYGNWCGELDEQLGTDEYRKLARKLRDLILSPCMSALL